MDKEKVINFIENSFLKPLLIDQGITDISYNGESLFYVSNELGRKKSSIDLSQVDAKDFIRQIANLCEKQFSYTVPELNVFVDKYRINAIHSSITKVNDEGSISFSVRIASKENKIQYDDKFINPLILELIDIIVSNSWSIVIGGVTSSGKTEFQKFIISRLKKNTRVIVIDNVLELERTRNELIDLTCWQIDEKNENASAPLLLRAALRNNPDWIILAEVRDKEMVDALNAAMTGMPIITTIHSKDVFTMPQRMGRLMLRSDQKIDFNEALVDIYHHFHFYFYLEKRNDGNRIERYISEVCFFDDSGVSHLLYKKNMQNEKFYKLPKNMLNIIQCENCSPIFLKTFMEQL